MATIGLTHNQEKTAAQSIEVNSSSSLNKFVEIIKHGFDTTDNQRSSKEELIETLKSTLMDNVQFPSSSTIEGKETGLTSSQEEALEKECYDCLVATTSLRVNAPKQLRTHLKTQIRHELKHLMMVNVESDGCAMDVEETNGQVSMSDVEQKDGDITDRLALLKENSDDLDQRGKNLHQASKIFTRSSDSVFSKAIYDTPPSSPITEDGPVFLKVLDSINISDTLFT